MLNFELQHHDEMGRGRLDIPQGAVKITAGPKSEKIEMTSRAIMHIPT